MISRQSKRASPVLPWASRRIASEAFFSAVRSVLTAFCTKFGVIWSDTGGPSPTGSGQGPDSTAGTAAKNRCTSRG